MKKLFAAFVCAFLMIGTASAEGAPQIELKAKSAVLMEAGTGHVIFELSPDDRHAPASITKIMTMLLTMEAIDSGQITMEDTVIGSERAKSMGGSTIFLDAGEEMSVRDILKGIAVASGNDACVAIAEHISGSEQEFVRAMNERAAQLGMENTNFVNTNGLDADDHYTSAKDIAIMSRELLKHPEILRFTTIWMDSLRNGAFELANTNKLIRFYQGANGLKTGSTDKALFCLSATAKREDMQLIAVVMGSPTSKTRFADASGLLDYGFATYAVTGEAKGSPAGEISVSKGVLEKCPLVTEEDFQALIPKAKRKAVEKKTFLPETVEAPVEKGQRLGEMQFFLEGEEIGKVGIVCGEDIPRLGFTKVFLRTLREWLGA